MMKQVFNNNQQYQRYLKLSNCIHYILTIIACLSWSEKKRGKITTYQNNSKM